VTVVEEGRDLERRVERLEFGQRALFETANYLRVGNDAQTERLDRIDGRLDRVEGRLDRIEGDIETLKTDMIEVKGGITDLRGQINRVELASVRRFDKIDAQFEALRGYIADQIARHEQGNRDPAP
jgi:archaellum component FlaC